jgi:hypothetical protein
MDSTVLAACINSGGLVLASIITASIAGWFGRRWLNQENLKNKLSIAQGDIGFLLEVERLYLEQTKEHSDVQGKNNTREQARKNGYKWSGENTNSKIKG